MRTNLKVPEDLLQKPRWEIQSSTQGDRKEEAALSRRTVLRFLDTGVMGRPEAGWEWEEIRGLTSFPYTLDSVW